MAAIENVKSELSVLNMNYQKSQLVWQNGLDG